MSLVDTYGHFCWVHLGVELPGLLCVVTLVLRPSVFKSFHTSQAPVLEASCPEYGSQGQEEELDKEGAL